LAKIEQQFDQHWDIGKIEQQIKIEEEVSQSEDRGAGQ
jgi:hypothetical protein